MRKPKLIFWIGTGLLAFLALQGFLAIQPTLAAQVNVADAPPVLPSGFWGTVKIDGENAPLGATVSAWINGVQYANAVTELYDPEPKGGEVFTVYSLEVPGDQVETKDVIEGGNAGDTVVFKIDGKTLFPSGVWKSGSNTETNLRDLIRIFIPAIYK